MYYKEVMQQALLLAKDAAAAGSLIWSVGVGVGVGVGLVDGIGLEVGVGEEIGVGFTAGAADLIAIPLFQTSLVPFLIHV